MALFTLYCLVTFSQHHEMGPYNTGAGSGTTDYVFALMFGMVAIILTYQLMNMFMPTPAIFAMAGVFYVLYAWIKRHPTIPVTFWLVQLKAIQLSFALYY